MSVSHLITHSYATGLLPERWNLLTALFYRVHYILIHTILMPAYSSTTSISTTHCQAWFLFLFTGCTLLAAFLDAVLFLRGGF